MIQNIAGRTLHYGMYMQNCASLVAMGKKVCSDVRTSENLQSSLAVKIEGSASQKLYQC